MKHEWIEVFGIEICHWCGVARANHNKTECRGKVKIETNTKDGKPKVTKR